MGGCFEKPEAMRKEAWIPEGEACLRLGSTVDEMWDEERIEGQQWGADGQLWVKIPNFSR